MNSDRLIDDGIGVRTVAEVDVPETEGERHRLRTDAELEEVEDDKYREVTSRDLGRRATAPLSGSEGNKGGLVGL